MSSNKPDIQNLVKATVTLLLKAPMLTVPQAMRAGNFSDAQSKNPALQMRVRRALSTTTTTGINHSSIIGHDVNFSSPMPTISTFSSSSTTTIATTSSASPQTTADTSTLMNDLIHRPQLDQVRLTAVGKGKAVKNRKASDSHYTMALKRATRLYYEELQKPEAEERKSAYSIEKDVKQQFDGVGPSARTITRYVNENCLVNASPVKRGNPGYLPAWAFESLCVALESYISINQVNANCHNNGKKNLASRVNGAAARDDVKGNKLLDRIVRNKSIDLNAAKLHSMEARRIQWTTSKNLTMWFNNWGKDLVQLGFATQLNVDGNIHIPEEQLGCILNFDETCLSLDGSGKRGGRPEVIFYNPLLPQMGRATSKSALTMTMITGSNALGEAIPPHFQFQTSAKSVETQQVRFDTAIYFPGVLCKFGMKERVSRGVSIGVNEKGGMDEAEFEKYVKNSIMPLYPDALDIPGKRVMVKVDSGPGRLNVSLLAQLRERGWYLYPGVPNTTAVLQETDRNYGPFKTQFRKNLETIVDVRLAAKESVSLQPWLVGMIVFGGTDFVTGYELTDCAFTRGFSKIACLNAWAKVGAAPLTRKCLSDPKVSKTLGDGDGKFDEYLLSIQVANDLATYALTEGGFKGELLKVKLVPRKEEEELTVPNSKAMIDKLAKATTHGTKFLATKGSHLMTDDFFIAQRKNEAEKELEKLLRVKKQRVQAMKTHDLASEIMEKKATEIQQLQFGNLSLLELDILLRWHNSLSGMKSKAVKADKAAKLKEIFSSGKSPPSVEEWTVHDEENLL